MLKNETCTFEKTLTSWKGIACTKDLIAETGVTTGRKRAASAPKVKRFRRDRAPTLQQYAPFVLPKHDDLKHCLNHCITSHCIHLFA